MFNALFKAKKIRMEWATRTPWEWERVLHVDRMLPEITMHHEPSEDEAKRLYELLMGIHGVQAVGALRYELTIKKGELFSWQEVLPRVTSVVEEFFTT